MLPQAKFVFIHRHPFPMFNSYLHRFPGLFKQRPNYAALLDPKYAALFNGQVLRRRILLAVFRSKMMSRSLLACLVDSFKYYIAHVGKLPKDQYVSVRYEDACADPATSLRHISQALSLNFTPRVPPKFVSPRNLSIPESVKQLYDRCVEEMTPYFQHCN